MVSSAKLALFAFLRSVGSISLGRDLKAFILRCVLLWPRILRSLRKIWSWYFQTSPRDEKRTKGDTGGPSSPETMGKREECVVVCASDFGGGGKPRRRSILGSSNTEPSIPLEEGSIRPPSVPHSLSPSRAPSPPPSSPHNSARSLQTDGSRGSVYYRSHTPVSWTHSRATARQFTGGASPRIRSRPSSTFLRHSSRPNTPTRPDFDLSILRTATQDSQGHPEDSTSGASTQLSPRDRSRPPSPSRTYSSRPDTPTSPDIFASSLPAMTQDPQGSLGDSTSGVSIQVEQPSRSASPENTESMHSTSRRLPSLDGLTQSFPTSHQHPSTESVNSSAVSSDLSGHSPSMSVGHISAQDSKESIQDPLTSQPTQTPQITFPVPSTSRRLTKTSTTNDITQRTPGVSHSRTSSHAPSPQGSPKLPDVPLPLDSPYTLASSLRAESPQLSPVHGLTSSLPTHHQFSSTESMNPSVVASHSREPSPSMHWVNPGANQSRGSFQGSVTSQSSRAPDWPPFMDPDPSTFRMSAQISTTNAPNSSSRPGTPLVRPMHSDQVSRYVKKGDV